MQFSDTTNKDGLLQRIEDYAGFDDGTITDDSVLLKKFTAHANEALYDITTTIMMAEDSFDWDDPTKLDYPIATTPLVAGQRDYQFDSISFLRLKRVDVSYDGTNYYRATPFDSSQYDLGLGNDDQVDKHFSRTEPRYDPKAFGFWLYPLASADDVASGGKIRIEYTRAFTEFSSSDTTKVPPIDRPWHDLIAIGAALKWSVMKDEARAGTLSTLYNDGLERIKKYYGQRNEDAQLIFNPQVSDYI